MDADTPTRSSGLSPRAAWPATFPIVSLFGIRILVHVRVVLFTLLAIFVASPVSPVDVPGWFDVSPTTFIVFSTPMMVGSILAHELAHAFVGRLVGVPIRSVVVDVNGGHTTPAQAPGSAFAEMSWTAAGPLANLVLWTGFAGYDLVRGGVPGVGFAATFNLLLIFNLLPILPMDGGRVYSAAIWMATGDRERARRIAADSGRIVAAGFVFLLAGVMAMRIGPAAGGAAGVAGLLLLFGRDRGSSPHFDRIYAHSVADVMVPGIRVDPTALARSVVQDRIDRTYSPDASRLKTLDLPYVAITGNGSVEGMLTATDVDLLSRRTLDWTATTVRDVMTPFEQLVTIEPGMEAFTALVYMTERQLETLLVLEDGEPAGCVTAKRIVALVRPEEAGTWRPAGPAGAAASVDAPQEPTGPRDADAPAGV